MRFLLISLLLLLTACTDSPQAPAAAEKNISPNYRIGHFMSPERGRFANSYWIEGPQGLILIGTQFLPEYARQAVDIAESYTGKKVVLAIVLHASPDQFNGVATLQQRGIRVASSAPVVEGIAAADEQARQRFALVYGEAYPEHAALPEASWTKTTVFEAAGLQLKLLVIRAGQSPAHLLVDLDHHLFVGDLVNQGYHADLQLGQSKAWLERLEEMDRFGEARVIHPGHGYAMAAGDLLPQQRRYLQAFQRAVADRYAGAAIEDRDVKVISEQIQQAYPDYGLVDVLAPGIRAEWRTLLEQDHAMMKQAGSDD